MAEKKKMSVAEILAAARKLDSGAGGAAEPAPTSGSMAPESTAPESAAEATQSAAAAEPTSTPKPTSKPAAGKPAAASGGRPSTADILAMARAKTAAKEVGGEAPGETSAAQPAAPKPAAKPVAAEATTKTKPAAAKAESKTAAAAAGPKDTASILAAARKGAKPGPISKAEAAAKGQLLPAAATAVGATVVKGHGAAVKESLTVPPMPPKPDYAKPKFKEPTPEVDRDRRTFAIVGILVGSFLAVGFSTLSATLGLWTLGLARFMFPNVLREPPSQFKVGFPSDFAYGAVETKFIPQYGVWVANYEYKGQRQIYALKSVCTHLGCTPNWLEAEQKFKCPCHGSGFYKDGINFEGPAPRPLERYAIEIAEDGQLRIDKSKTFQEEMGAWEDPTSFVPV